MRGLSIIGKIITNVLMREKSITVYFNQTFLIWVKKPKITFNNITNDFVHISNRITINQNNNSFKFTNN